MARTMRIGLLLALVMVTGCRFAARQKTNMARLLASSLAFPFTELQKKAPLTQSSFRNDVVTPKQQRQIQNVQPAPRPAAQPVAAPTPDAQPQPIVLAALHIPANLPGVVQARAKMPYVMARYRPRAGVEATKVDGKAIEQLVEQARCAGQRAVRVRIQDGRRHIIVIDSAAPHPSVEVPIEAIGATIDG